MLSTKKQEPPAKLEETESTLLGRTKQIFSKSYGTVSPFIQAIKTILAYPLVSETFFILFALLFANRFFWVNIQQNGETNVSVFVGYSLWIWIAFFITILLICRFLKFRRDRSLLSQGYTLA